MGVYESIPKLIRSAGAQAVVLAGDLLGSAMAGVETNSIEEAQRLQSDVVGRILQAVAVPVLYIMGNDDMIQWDFKDYPFHSLHGRSVQIRGFRFVGYQNTPPFMGGIHEKPEHEMQRELKLLDAHVQAGDILISHGPAAGILDTTFSGEQVGSPALLAFRERNDFRCHIHGHIHESFGRTGRAFNVAIAHSRRATLIDLADLMHDYLAIS